MKNTWISIIILLLVIGCATTTFITHGISNFRTVDASKAIYRGGQPDTNGFVYLKSIGVSNIIKLNSESEGSDNFAKSIGMKVVYDPIPFFWEQLTGPVPQWKVDMAVTNITNGTYIHCEHGQDRTGLICATYEISKGKSKKDAEKEMLDDGFHKTLHGLWKYFENIK